MKVRLISYSQAAPDFELRDPNLLDLISYCARVSNPANQLNTETSDKLIRYLLRHKHFSPFEMVSACLEIDTTRDIAHQIIRHRSGSYQEYSQRYAAVDEMGFEFREARLQDAKNRQNSIAADDPELQAAWRAQQEKVLAAAKEAYRFAIDSGIAKEQARVVLPEGMTKTRLLMNATIRTWIHYIELRAAEGSQKEHMEVARACAEVIAKIFPAGDLLASGN